MMNSESLSSFDNKLHESEFFFHLGENLSTKIPGSKFDSRGYIRGFIDLIFQYENKYYILDWKSNYIEEGYTRDLLNKNILLSNYELQYKIYIIALVTWLKQIKPDFNFERDFGGVYYLYLRGMDPDDPEKGVYYFKPENEDEMIEYYKEIFELRSN